jgi:hypothetical protein
MGSATKRCGPPRFARREFKILACSIRQARFFSGEAEGDPFQEGYRQQLSGDAPEVLHRAFP